MKKNVILILTIATFAIGGTLYAFNAKSDCPLKGTKDCPEYQNCPKKGQADCPIIQNCPDKGTADCKYTNGKASCCEKK